MNEENRGKVAKEEKAWRLRLAAEKLEYAAGLAWEVGEIAMWEDIATVRDWATRLAKSLEKSK